MDDMRIYDVGGRLAWYHPDDAPEGAVPATAGADEKQKPAPNKARRTQTKSN